MEPMKPAGFYMKEVNPERKIAAGEGLGNRANIVQFDEHLETTDRVDIISGETKFEDTIKEAIKEMSVPVESMIFAANEPEKNESVDPAKETLKDQMDKMSPEEKINALSGYTNLISMQARKNSLYSEIDHQNQKVNEFKKHVAHGEDSDFIEDKLRECKTVEELQARIKTKEGLDYFYTDPETGDVLETTDDIKESERENFRKAYLVFLKNNQIAMDGIDEELRKYDEAIAEFDEDIRDVMAVMADNVLTYTDYLKNSVPKDHPNYKRMMKTVKYIESGYDMSVFSEVLDKYPSVIKHTLEDFRSDKRTKEIGSRYFKKLASSKVTSSLIGFVSDDPHDSYEYKALLPNQYKSGMENLFVFSLIRFFSMESWTDTDIKKCHASLIVALKKLTSPNINDDLKDKMRSSIAAYLQKFYDAM